MSIDYYIRAEDLSPPARVALGRIEQVSKSTDNDLFASEDLVSAIYDGLGDEDRRAVAEVFRCNGELSKRQAHVYLAEKCSPGDLEPSDFE